MSPLNSVSKKDSAERRIILDLSWPLNTTVNAGIDKSLHEGVEFSLTYPTVDQIASLIARKGPGCLIYKCDLRKAYRQFYVDPYDFLLLGFTGMPVIILMLCFLWVCGRPRWPVNASRAVLRTFVHSRALTC